ncbi:MAG TPA: hypothetical protein VJ975_11770 [Candidatus Limnocylindria bacterium]|nr:hypothetical protein [Candidatus Limnocylindria bacterium]
MSDQPTLIYLEADDEITAVVRRVRAADAGRVVIVAPGRSRATSSAVALRLLARAAADDEREIAVVGDELTRPLAVEAGLTAYRSVDDARSATAPASDEPAPARHAAIHVVRGRAAEDTAPTLATIPTAETETRPVAIPAPHRERPTPQPGPARRPRPTRVARRPDRRSPNALVAVLGIAGAFIVIAAVLGAMFLPAATIAITPRSEPVGPVEYTITVEDPQRTTGTVTETATVTASGSYAIEAAATGTVVFFNWNFVPVEVEAGTFVAAGEQAFATAAAITVPAGDLTGEGTIQAGEQAVNVTAAAVGPAANVAAAAINEVLDDQTARRLRGFPRNTQPLVTNPEPTTGGVATTGVEITQADVDAATQQLRDALTTGLETALEGTDVGLFADPAEPAEPVITIPEGLVGTRDQAEAEISGELAYDRLTIEESDVEARAQERFVNDASVLPDGTQLLTDAIEVRIGDVTRQGDALAVQVTVSGRATTSVSREEVVQGVIGLSEAEAEAALAPLGQAEVTLWPGWVSTVPDRDWRIEVEISGVEEPIAEPSPS